MARNRLTGFPKYLSFVTNRLSETAVWAFAELKLADLLATADTPQTAEQLAKKQGWNSELLYRLLRAVAEADIVHEIKSKESIHPEQTNHFELTEDGRFLTSDHPSKCRSLLCFELNPRVKAASAYLPQLIREGYSKGNGAEQASGNVPFFEFIAKEENREIANCFDEAMTSYSTYSRKLIVNNVDFSRFDTIVDIGGSKGTLLAYILKQYPTIKRGICFDLPNVVQQLEDDNEFSKQNISKDRYEYVSGDMFDGKTIPQADAYVLQNVIHDWNDERAIDILKSIHEAANGKEITIFIIGYHIIPEIEQDQFIRQTALAFDLHMLISLTAKERTQTQHEHLFEKSGFRFKNLYRTQTPFSVIEAVSN